MTSRHFMFRRLSMILIVFFLMGTAFSAAPVRAQTTGVRYAKPDGLTTGDCAAWETACTIVNALQQVQAGEQVWISQGTYEIQEALVLKSNVALYGGFLGSETTLGQRPVAPEKTIFRGVSPVESLITANGVIGVVMDGFDITNGGGRYGAIYLLSTEATLRNLIVENNSAEDSGGGIYIDRGSLFLDKSTVRYNLSVDLHKIV